MIDDSADAVVAADAKVVALGDVVGEHDLGVLADAGEGGERTLRSRFCASSTMMNAPVMERPRIWVSGMISSRSRWMISSTTSGPAIASSAR